MRYSLLLFGSLCIAGIACAQPKISVPAQGATYMNFIPKGYDTLQYGFAKGDLNKDGKEDIVLVLADRENEGKDEQIIDNGPKRLLVVLFNNDQGYKLADSSTKVILCYNCGGAFGEPFSGVDIKNSVLSINHYGGASWRWSYIHKFRYQSGAFHLIGKTYHNYWSVMQCESLDDEFPGTFEDINLVTGQREKKVITEECDLTVNKKDKIAVKPLIKLKDFDIDSVLE